MKLYRCDMCRQIVDGLVYRVTGLMESQGIEPVTIHLCTTCRQALQEEVKDWLVDQ